MARRFGLLGFVLAASCVQLALAGPAAAGWSAQRSGTSALLRGVACPTATQCWAVGTSGAIVHTDDAGLNWRTQPSGTSNFLHAVACSTVRECFADDYDNGNVHRTADGGGSWRPQAGINSYLLDVACPAVDRCYTVGQWGRVLIINPTSGSGWSAGSTPTTSDLYSISCVTAQLCYSAGQHGRIMKTTNGGGSWTVQNSGLASTEVLEGISCGDANHCAAVGTNGKIVRTANGGTTWSSGNSGTTSWLYGVACPTSTRCWAVGSDANVFRTDDGGATWTPEPSGSPHGLTDITCVTEHACWIVGGDGTILTNTQLAACSSGSVGIPPACVDTSPASPVPSNDCSAPATTFVVVDGYVGSLYTRLRAERSAGHTWVCVRIQPEGGQEYAGGKFVVNEPGSLAGVDEQAGACDDNPAGFRHITGGDLAGSPYSLDTWTGDDAAWVCLQAAGLNRRVMLDTGSPGLPFEQDNPAQPSPLRTPWTAGVPSAACEAQAGGTKTRLVNAVLVGVQAWVSARQSGTKTELCVRAQQGATSAGGRLTIDASPGLQPVVQTGSDMTGCDTPVFSNDTAQLVIRRSNNNANPASVCVQQGANVIRLTAGFTGAVNPNMVSWTKD